jgi:hypothetical protein
MKNEIIANRDGIRKEGTLPDSNLSGRLTYCLYDISPPAQTTCIDKYLEFSNPFYWTCLWAAGAVGSVQNLSERVILDATGNENILAEESPQSCPVAATRTNDGPGKLFKSYGFHSDKCPIWQAAHASCATPTFFPQRGWAVLGIGVTADFIA